MLGHPLLLSGSSGIDVGDAATRSLRFNSGDSPYLYRTPAGASNRKTHTLSMWVKRSALGVSPGVGLYGAGASVSNYTLAYFTSGDNLRVAQWDGLYTYLLDTNAVFRDVSSWYHIVIATDTTQATAANRIKVYVNGVQITSFSTASYPTLNLDTYWNDASQHEVGNTRNPGTYYFDGYMYDFVSVDGQALDPTAFGRTSADTGVWVPKNYAGSYGTNGFRLTYSDNSGTTSTTLGKDSSGNGNNFTPSGFSVSAGVGNDSLLDTPVISNGSASDTGAGGEVSGSYCTLSPYFKKSSITLANGNLQVPAFVGYWFGSTWAISSGKWYWEFVVTSGTCDIELGIVTPDRDFSSSLSNSSGGQAYIYKSNNGQKASNSTFSAYGATYTVNDVIGVALDADNGTLTFYKNGVSQGTAFSSIGAGPWVPAAANTTGNTMSLYFNFGQRPYSYAAPSGYKALCTDNLSDPTTKNPAKVFDVKLYTGTGASQSVTNTGVFSPGLLITKARSTGTAFKYVDNVRGSTKSLTPSTNSTAAESTDTNGVTSLDASGFTLGTDSNYNANTVSFWSAMWSGGSSPASNTSGSITSSVSANNFTGMSVVTYTGTGANATIGHGLSSAPAMIIVKRRDSTGSFAVYHKSLTSAAYRLSLDTDGAESSSATTWNSTAPTSSVFSVGTHTDVNASGGTYVAWCFAEVPGLSAFGKYTGNASADGPVIFMSLKPKLFIAKEIAGANASSAIWDIFDSVRDASNAVTTEFNGNNAAAETTGTRTIDFLANGVKIRTTNRYLNESGTYIYAAFADSPFKYARAR